MCGTELVAPLAPVATAVVPSAAPVAAVVIPVSSATVTAPPLPPTPAPPPVCTVCGGQGKGLKPEQDICTECGWLRPLLPGYQLDRSVFLWSLDGQAMTKLHSMSSLTAIARSVSDKVGRPWIEATFNGIRLGPKQLPDVWHRAVLAARILGLETMPDVYVSGDHMWDTYTFGSDTSSFIVLGTSILNNFRNDDLLFVLSREMGHCRAGHALWKTVVRFVAGDLGPHSSLLSGGMLGAINPMKLLESAVEMPLMAWSRQSDVTADRAGLLAIGDEALARRVLLAWSIRSSTFLKRVNIEEWMKQEENSDAQMTRISEFTTSSAMYTTRRLHLLAQAARETDLMRWSASIQPVRKQLSLPPHPPQGPSAPASPPPTAKNSIRVVCDKCQAPMRIPFSVLQGKSSLNVRCPQCHNVYTLRSKPTAPPPAQGSEQK
jgi:Zn-dependent protease with chaperone function